MTSETPSENGCPFCGSPLEPVAILCVQCGYDIRIGKRRSVSKSGDSVAPQDFSNPYSAPTEEEVLEQDTGEFDLDAEGLRKVNRVVNGSKTVFVAAVCFICCIPVWIVLLPYYGFLLMSWKSLHLRYNELRFPNSFSPHGKLATEFEDARFRLILGVVFGCVGFVVVGLAMLFRRS